MSNIEHMVNRFLAWKLPADFSPDAGIGFKPYHPQQTPDNPMWPTGTNLLTAEQARGMFEYVLEGAQQPRQRPKLTPEDIAAEDAAGGVFAAGALVAQQPQYEAADMASAAAQGFRDGVASVAQQPQAEDISAFLRSEREGWEEREPKPQAEAVPPGFESGGMASASAQGFRDGVASVGVYFAGRREAISHQYQWRHALELAKQRARTKDVADYWEKEIQAFDNALSALLRCDDSKPVHPDPPKEGPDHD